MSKENDSKFIRFIESISSGSLRLFNLNFGTIVFFVTVLIWFFVDNSDIKYIMSLIFVSPFVWFFNKYIDYFGFFFGVGNSKIEIVLLLCLIIGALIFKIFDILFYKGYLPEDTMLNNGTTASFSYFSIIYKSLNFLFNFYTNYFSLYFLISILLVKANNIPFDYLFNSNNVFFFLCIIFNILYSIYDFLKKIFIIYYDTYSVDPIIKFDEFIFYFVINVSEMEDNHRLVLLVPKEGKRIYIVALLFNPNITSINDDTSPFDVPTKKNNYYLIKYHTESLEEAKYVFDNFYKTEVYND